jgi:hypothetical protein
VISEAITLIMQNYNVVSYKPPWTHVIWEKIAERRKINGPRWHLER